MSEKRYDLPEGHYASVRRFSLNDVTVVTEDPDVRRYIDVVNDELGEDGRFIVRFSGIFTENRVMAESLSEDLCEELISCFISLLEEKGYLYQD